MALHVRFYRLLLTVVVVACGCKGSPKPHGVSAVKPAPSLEPGPSGTGPTPSSPGPLSPAPSGPSSPETPAPAGSLDKVADAYRRGEIDRVSSLKLSMFAVFRPDHLPEAYRGLRPSADQPDLFAAVAAELASFDPATQAELRGYFLPPTEAGSFWSSSFVSTPTRGAPAFVDSERYPLRVWYTTDAAANAAQASALVKELERHQVWQRGTQVLRTPPCRENTYGQSDSIDVYLVDDSAAEIEPTLSQTLTTAVGVAMPTDTRAAMCAGSAVFILLKRTADDLDSALAHELFHAFQYAYDSTNDTSHLGENRWYTESTAEWFADSIYQRSDKRLTNSVLWNTKSAAPGQVGQLDSQADRASGRDDHYATYVFWRNQIEQRGMPIGTIESIHTQLKSKTALSQVMALPGFAEDFVHFTESLFNLKPFDRLNIWREKLSQAKRSQFARSDAVHSMFDVLMPGTSALSARYFWVEVADKAAPSGARGLEISFSNRHPDLSVRAILETNKHSVDDDLSQPADYTASVRNWSAENKVKLCFDQPDENVDEIVLVLTNPTASRIDAFHMQVKRLNEPCTTDRGSMSYHSSAHQTIPAHDEYQAATWDSSFDFTSQWVVAFDSYDEGSREVFFSFESLNSYAGHSRYSELADYENSPIRIVGSKQCQTTSAGVSENPSLPDSAAAHEAANGGYDTTAAGQIVVQLPPSDNTPTATFTIYYTPALIYLTDVYSLTRSEFGTLTGSECGNWVERSTTYSSADGKTVESYRDCSSHTDNVTHDLAKPYVSTPSVAEVFSGEFNWQTGVIDKTFSRPACVINGASKCANVSQSAGPCSGMETFSVRVQLPPFVTTR